MSYESFTVSVRPVTLERMEALFRGAAEAERENDVIQRELMELANECRARIQHIVRGDIQQQ